MSGQLRPAFTNQFPDLSLSATRPARSRFPPSPTSAWLFLPIGLGPDLLVSGLAQPSPATSSSGRPLLPSPFRHRLSHPDPSSISGHLLRSGFQARSDLSPLLPASARPRPPTLLLRPRRRTPPADLPSASHRTSAVALPEFPISVASGLRPLPRSSLRFDFGHHQLPGLSPASALRLRPLRSSPRSASRPRPASAFAFNPFGLPIGPFPITSPATSAIFGQHRTPAQICLLPSVRPWLPPRSRSDFGLFPEQPPASTFFLRPDLGLFGSLSPVCLPIPISPDFGFGIYFPILVASGFRLPPSRSAASGLGLGLITALGLFSSRSQPPDLT